MKRKIIKIEEEKCDGCGLCIPDCPEGALQVIDGKARLVSDLFCDGLGACVGTCPNDAMTVEEREAEPYDEKKVMANIVKCGEATILAHLEHLKDHGETELYNLAIEYLNENDLKIPETPAEDACEGGDDKMACGCSGSMAREIKREPVIKLSDSSEQTEVQSELRQWPVQLKLLNPNAQYFKNVDLLIAADCVPFAYGGFHSNLLKGKIVIMFCPKLDQGIDEYIEKMAAIFSNMNIKSLTIARMEVPCCGGTNHIINEALKKAGRDIPIEEIIISMTGDIKERTAAAV